jgi:hypothetical protein
MKNLLFREGNKKRWLGEEGFSVFGFTPLALVVFAYPFEREGLG